MAVTDEIDRSLLLRPAQFEGQYDPHVWFDVSLWMKAVERVRDTLIELDPGSAELYRANADAYLARVWRICTATSRQQAERIPPEQRVLVTAHDAFNYFGRAYGFEVRGLQGISTAAEAGASDVRGLADFLAAAQDPGDLHRIVCARPQHRGRAGCRPVTRAGTSAVGGELFSDAMGSAGTPEGTYIGMVRHNIDTIVRRCWGDRTETATADGRSLRVIMREMKHERRRSGD